MELDRLLTEALAEDIGDGDHTSLACIPPQKTGKAHLKVKESGILAGWDLAQAIFKKVDQQLEVRGNCRDGQKIDNGDLLFEVAGPLRSILTAERLVLNCMQRMSGIATQTRRYVDAISDTGTKVLDTRKTTPLLRELEKAAVRIGGGVNHRFGLYDMILIKDNHVDSAGGITRALEAASHYRNQNKPELSIEIETRNLDEVKEVLTCGLADRIMLDNFSPALLHEAVSLIGKKMPTEASGGITLINIREYALTGVDFISVGALTHSVKSLDLSLKVF